MKSILILAVFLFISIVLSAQTSEIQTALDNYRYKDALALIDNEPQTAENLRLKASVYEKLYNYSAALAIYEQLLQQHPNDVNLVISMAECASQAGNAQQSLRRWITADSLSPENLFIQTKKAMAYYRNSNWKETIEASQPVFRSDSIPLLLRMVGDAHQNLYDPIWANYYYTKALEKNPSDHVALSRICEYFYAMEEEGYDTVVVMTEKYLTEINPNQTTIGQLNGMANYSIGEFDKAIDRLTKNVELGDSSYTTVYFLGMSNYGKRWYYEAIKWLELAYHRNRNDVNIYYYYGTALGNGNKQKQAVKILQEGMDLIGEMSEKLFDFDISMAETYLKMNNRKAIDYYSSAYKRRPAQHQLLYSIARAYDTMKDQKNAITFYERFLKTAPADLDVTSIAFTEDEKMTMKNFYYINSFRRIKELQEQLFMQSGKK